ncbi:hypothetical protein HAX54_023127 [Datura stramonium]|uniref:DUF4408 domain-containing protein n=1 Tax=Datura stramonium TaxID=4076 RepID=A0ABS8RK16_DATST|nr:hypothetical protein [Datura stramonium]
MDSLNFQQNIKVEKNNVILRYKRPQIVTSLFRFIELYMFFFVISRFSAQLRPSVEYFKGLCITLISPLFVFLVGNAIVIILFLLKYYQPSSTKHGSTVNHAKDDFYYKACIPSTRQVKRKIYRSKSERLMNKLSVPANNRVLRRSATVACGRYGEKPAAEMTGAEFRRTVEAFIAKQQRFLREEEFSATQA